MNTRTPADWKALFESDAFAQQNTYTGPLGVEYTPAGTRLRLWAPTARQVYVNLYRRGDGGVCIGSLPLEKRGQGLWSVYLPGDQHGRYYTYTLHAGGTSWEAADPYARAAGVNGRRSMIADFARIDPPGWLHDHRPNIPVSHRSVWEVNVRDFSQDPASGVRPAWRGKYLAFAQQGTTLHSDGIHPTCLNYLKRLGVSYVQLMPIFDFGSVDESRSLTRQYNWGYDTAHFNIPEGSYSTDPTRGEVRVRECKQMIAALHAAGIGVIMDVVYNHMYGNDNVLNRAELDQLPGGQNILMYGEPWQGGVSALHRYEANKNNLAMLNERIGIFCDNTRDAIKGGCFDAREPGYVEGRESALWDIGAAVAAWCRSSALPPHSPGQIVSYVSAHDNFTLWDKLLFVRYKRPEYGAMDSVALAQNRLAAGIYLTCMGLPFWQAGEEFARTKKGQGNSYRSSPALNRLDWQRAQQFHELVDYYRGLIGLRRYFPRLSALDTASPAAIQFFSLEQPLVGWQLPANCGDGALWQALCVFYNPTGQEKAVPLPEGNWKLLSDGISSSLWRGESQIRSGQTVLLPYSATIFGKA